MPLRPYLDARGMHYNGKGRRPWSLKPRVCCTTFCKYDLLETPDTEYIVNDHGMLQHVGSECTVCHTRCVGCLACVAACADVSESIMVGVDLEDE